MYCNISLDTLHIPVLQVPLGDGLIVILYPVMFDPPLSDGVVHSIVTLLYVVDCTSILGGLGGSKILKLRQFYLHVST